MTSSSRRSFVLRLLAPALALPGGMATFARAGAAPAVPTGTLERRPGGRLLQGNPQTYLGLLRILLPGDTLVLAPGLYDPPEGHGGLPVFDLHGRPEAPITISGPDEGGRPVIAGRAGHNTVRIGNASHVVIRNLDVDARGLGGDGVNNQAASHDITLDGLAIRGVGVSQQVVGISTNRAPAWNWTIRRTTISGAGTGMYLGNSDGANPFVNGLIEHNLIVDTIGYNLQVKHQAPWPTEARLPVERTFTVIRHNVFAKGRNSSTGGLARPNVLVGDVPSSGPGSDNGYRIHGNFFYQNPSEALFQGEGNLAFYSNVLVNDAGPGIVMRNHNGHLREALVFGNTVVSRGPGLVVRNGHPAYRRRVFGNAIFAGGRALSAPDASHNVIDRYERAADYLRNPGAPLPALDLRPRGVETTGAPVPGEDVPDLPDAQRDFDGGSRDWSFRGAYASADRPLHWKPALAIKR